jgi:exopolyphosphatase/pppGpp-phosphohydrolase
MAANDPSRSLPAKIKFNQDFKEITWRDLAGIGGTWRGLAMVHRQRRRQW